MFGRRVPLRGGGGRRRHGIDGFIAFFFLQLLYRVSELPVKPVVSLGVAAVCCVVHFGDFLGLHLPHLGEVCTPPALLWVAPSFELAGRVVVSAFYHASDWHLYYNCASLVGNGVVVENVVGPVEYARTVFAVLVLSKALYVASAVVAVVGFGHNTHFTTCSVGISGVVFGVKAIATHHLSHHTSVTFGFAVPTRYLVWLELLIYHLLYPFSSFWGHLCGIMAGYLWLYRHVILGLVEGTVRGGGGGGLGGQARPRFRGGGAVGNTPQPQTPNEPPQPQQPQPQQQQQRPPPPQQQQQHDHAQQPAQPPQPPQPAAHERPSAANDQPLSDGLVGLAELRQRRLARLQPRS